MPDTVVPYTEGKVLGGFIMAATEYERLMDATADIKAVKTQANTDDAIYSLTGYQLAQVPEHGIYIKGGRKLNSLGTIR